MRCKLRTVSRYRSGSVSRGEQLIETAGSRLTLGRGTDSDIFLKDLRVSYRHAEIVLRDFDAIIEAVGESDLRIDGVLVERGLLVPDAEIEVGPYRLQVLPAEADVDLALERLGLELVRLGRYNEVLAPLGKESLPSFNGYALNVRKFERRGASTTARLTVPIRRKERRKRGGAERQLSRSKIPAAPIPPPMHIVTMP